MINSGLDNIYVVFESIITRLTSNAVIMSASDMPCPSKKAMRKCAIA